MLLLLHPSEELLQVIFLVGADASHKIVGFCCHNFSSWLIWLWFWHFCSFSEEIFPKIYSSPLWSMACKLGTNPKKKDMSQYINDNSTPPPPFLKVFFTCPEDVEELLSFNQWHHSPKVARMFIFNRIRIPRLYFPYQNFVQFYVLDLSENHIVTKLKYCFFIDFIFKTCNTRYIPFIYSSDRQAMGTRFSTANHM